MPSNVLKPNWALIKGMPAGSADGTISWDEVAEVPAGSADGKEDRVVGLR